MGAASTIRRTRGIIKLLSRPAMRKIWATRVKTRIAVISRRFFAPHPGHFPLAGHLVGEGAPVYIIAEIGVNHDGDIEKAKRLIDEAFRAGANAVKFQKRDLYACYRRDVVDNPERYEQSFQYLIPILKKCEFGEKEYKILHDYAQQKKITMIATPFDEPSVDFLERVIAPPFYKVASADLTNTPLLERLVKIGKPLILSTGLSTLDEIDATAAWLHHRHATFIFLHCQSTYPAAPETLNLHMITALSERYGVPVGYSGHERGIDYTLAAVALGTRVVERHITYDKTAPGPDHAASLEPDEFVALVKKIRDFERAYGQRKKRLTKGFSRGEISNKPTLRKSLVATCAIPKGAHITREMLTAKSPGTGLSPQRIYELVGTHAWRDIAADEMLTETDITGYKKATIDAVPDFASHWGLKARYREMEQMLAFEPRPKLLEFHVSDKDLEFDTKAWEGKSFPFELFIHAPEYYGEDLIDLGSEDDRIWEQSIKIIQRTIDQTRAIKKYFANSERPKIIIHVGGCSIEPHKNPRVMFERAVKAFGKLNTEGVELLPENMPTLAWFFGGRWHINNFTRADEMVEFCKRTNTRMCLDTSHAWLACSDLGEDYLEFVKKVAPLTSHLQLADALGKRQKEGVQIGRGEIPFDKTFQILRDYLPRQGKNTSWVTEIWQGHLDEYQEFKVALRELSQYDFLKPVKRKTSV